MRKEYDLSNAKGVEEFPELERLREKAKRKTRITIMLDTVVIEAFKSMADDQDIGYQTLINQTLKNSLDKKPLDEEAVRRVVREEIGRYSSEQED
jgi:predicted DNA binding CopG/RHH family protein